MLETQRVQFLYLLQWPNCLKLSSLRTCPSFLGLKPSRMTLPTELETPTPSDREMSCRSLTGTQGR